MNRIIVNFGHQPSCWILNWENFNEKENHGNHKNDWLFVCATLLDLLYEIDFYPLCTYFWSGWMTSQRINLNSENDKDSAFVKSKILQLLSAQLFFQHRQKILQRFLKQNFKFFSIAQKRMKSPTVKHHLYRYRCCHLHAVIQLS